MIAAHQEYDWSAMCNMGLSVPGASFPSETSSSSLLLPRHLDLLFSQQCSIQTDLQQAYAGSCKHPEELVAQVEKKCTSLIDMDRTLPIFTT